MLILLTMKRTAILYLAHLVLLICTPLTGHPFDILPFHTQNQSPVVQIFGLPAISDSRILPAGGKELSLVLDIANNYVDDSARNERITLDGETYRLNLVGRFGIGNGLELGLEIPYVFQSGGFLDGFIENYHNTFGLPQGGRDQAPKDRLLFNYQRNGANLFRIDQSNSGLGDIRLTAGFQLYRDDTESPRALALRASLKVPTGDSDELHGSGSTDLAFWLTGSQGWKTTAGYWEIFGGGGILGMTKGNVLPDQQQNAVAFGSLGAGWQPLSWLTLKVQFDGNTAFYKDSDLVELSSGSVQIVMGGTLHFSDRTALDIGVSEDLAVNTAPDVVFHLALRHRF
jgi:Protein of unknown function (DUF3187)